MAKKTWTYDSLNTILLALVFFLSSTDVCKRVVLNTFNSAVSASQIFIMKITLIGVSYNQERHTLCFCFQACGEIFHLK